MRRAVIGLMLASCWGWAWGQTPSVFSADSTEALVDYWQARQRGARWALITGGALAVAGGTVLLATPREGSVAARTVGGLAAGVGLVLPSLSLGPSLRYRPSRLVRLLAGTEPVPPSLWAEALAHQRRLRTQR